MDIEKFSELTLMSVKANIYVAVFEGFLVLTWLVELATVSNYRTFQDHVPACSGHKACTTTYKQRGMHAHSQSILCNYGPFCIDGGLFSSH